MPSLSNSRTGSTAQIYGSEWGRIPGVWTLDQQILTTQSGTRTWEGHLIEKEDAVGVTLSKFTGSAIENFK